jgi:glycosyltransferase involved in cell wall biosynthesis
MLERSPARPTISEARLHTPTRRILCLADSGLVSQAAALVKEKYGAAPTLLVSFRQLRQQPELALRLPWRRFDVALAVLTDVQVPLYQDFILAYLFVLRAERKALCDIRGGEISVGSREGLRAVLHCFADLAGLPLGYARARLHARRLSQARPARYAKRPCRRRVAYLRANPWQESQAGGAVAHTAGVLSGLRAAGWEVTFAGTNAFGPAERMGLRTHVVPPDIGWLRNVLPFLAYGELFTRRCCCLLRDSPPDFIYQRYSLMNASGAEVATRLRCPFVLEYNGSEIWIARHWSTPLMFEGLAGRVEDANLRRADLIVVVSNALQIELVARGVPAERVLVNPNGVDPVCYHPGINGELVRRRLGLTGKLVIGFIGTFGPWHGADVLAQAVRRVTARLPEARFLFIGDGSAMPTVREIIARDGMEDRVSFAGLVPQDEAPAYLAACDILASPHVPNPDGSRFFGSPTKLFEYMAMGKSIVASDLEQIGEILSHGKTAWLVTPGDPDELAEGILALGRDPDLRRKLGGAARTEAEANYTWEAHVGRILKKMVELELLDPVGPLRPDNSRRSA